MKILILSDHETHGGASVAMQRLLQGLSNEPIDVLHVSCMADNIAGQHGHHVSRLLEPLHLTTVKRLVEKVGQKGLGTSIRARFLASHVEKALREFQPDVINIHNLHATGCGLEILAAIPENIPVIWTLHDMWSFTGRCAYNYDCDKFNKGCDSLCPTPANYPALDPGKIERAWNVKRAFIGRSATTLAVAPSKWLEKGAEIGIWGKGRVFHIPYGIDLNTYRPHSRAAAREMLGIGKDEFVMLAAATNFNEQRKGGALLRDMAEQLPIAGKLIAMGNSDMVGRLGELDFSSTGFLSDEISRILHYCAADILVHPALVDNLPNVVVEALACGLPVVALPIGGLPDMVVDGVTGWLAKESTANSLCAAICRAYSDKGVWEDYRVRSRQHAEENYDLSLQGGRYNDLCALVVKHPIAADFQCSLSRFVST